MSVGGQNTKRWVRNVGKRMGNEKKGREGMKDGKEWSVSSLDTESRKKKKERSVSIELCTSTRTRNTMRTSRFSREGIDKHTQAPHPHQYYKIYRLQHLLVYIGTLRRLPSPSSCLLEPRSCFARLGNA